MNLMFLGNDYDDTIDNFLNDFTNEAYDSEPILDKTDTKSGNCIFLRLLN